jgi:hypothetical protein
MAAPAALVNRTRAILTRLQNGVDEKGLMEEAASVLRDWLLVGDDVAHLITRFSGFGISVCDRLYFSAAFC